MSEAPACMYAFEWTVDEGYLDSLLVAHRHLHTK
jgi:hypothetical protein